MTAGAPATTTQEMPQPEVTEEVLGLLRRRQDLVLHEPAEPGKPWVIEFPEGRYVRLGADAARLLDAVGEGIAFDPLLEALGGAWTRHAIHATLVRFGAAGFLEPIPEMGDTAAEAGSAPPEQGLAPGLPPAAVPLPAVRPRPRRLRFQPPASIQFTLVDPGGFLRRHRGAFSAVANPAAAGLALAAGAAGITLLSAGDRIHAALATPLPIWSVVALLVAFIALSSVHELGHAATLARYGGTVRRMGAMLFYLTPAMFCDVSDAWVLPETRQRVRVALAGPIVNAGVAGTVALASLAAHGTAATWLTVLAVVAFGGAVWNLIPLVKFDGYIALMTHLDLPHLRAKAMGDWRAVAGRTLFGGAPRERAIPAWWSPVYGLACAVAPWVLVGLATWNIALAVSSWGRVGAAIRLLLVVAVGRVAVRSLLRLVTAARHAGADPRRIAGGLVLTALLTAGALAVPVGDTIHGGFVQTPAGTLLAIGDPTAAARIHPGDTVHLLRQGIALSDAAGVAVVSGPVVRRAESLQATVPFLETGVTGPAWTLALRDVTWSLPARTGGATVSFGHVSAGRWVVRNLLWEPLRSLI